MGSSIGNDRTAPYPNSRFSPLARGCSSASPVTRFSAPPPSPKPYPRRHRPPVRQPPPPAADLRPPPRTGPQLEGRAPTRAPGRGGERPPARGAQGLLCHPCARPQGAVGHPCAAAGGAQGQGRPPLRSRRGHAGTGAAPRSPFRLQVTTIPPALIVD